MEEKEEESIVASSLHLLPVTSPTCQYSERRKKAQD
jgi:hypothetical protein